MSVCPVFDMYSAIIYIVVTLDIYLHLQCTKTTIDGMSGLSKRTKTSMQRSLCRRYIPSQTLIEKSHEKTGRKSRELCPKTAQTNVWIPSV